MEKNSYYNAIAPRAGFLYTRKDEHLYSYGSTKDVSKTLVAGEPVSYGSTGVVKFNNVLFGIYTGYSTDAITYDDSEVTVNIRRKGEVYALVNKNVKKGDLLTVEVSTDANKTALFTTTTDASIAVAIALEVPFQTGNYYIAAVSFNADFIKSTVPSNSGDAGSGGEGGDGTKTLSLKINGKTFDVDKGINLTAEDIKLDKNNKDYKNLEQALSYLDKNSVKSVCGKNPDKNGNVNLTNNDLKTENSNSNTNNVPNI